MDNTKTSIISRIMAAISIISVGGLLMNGILHGNSHFSLEDILWFVVALSTIIISLPVLFSRFPHLLGIKIIFTVISIIPILVIIEMFYSYASVIDYYGIVSDELSLEALIFIIGCFTAFWTMSVMILHILPIKKKIWIISSICLFVLTLMIAMSIETRDGGFDETGAIVRLRDLFTVESFWQKLDPDRNGKNDFWTYDVSCLHRMYREDGRTKVNFIPDYFAKADANWASDNIFGAGVITPYDNVISTTPVSGYLYRSMLTDEEGKPYNENEVGEKKIKATNPYKFAFVAYPASYANTGVRTFIINESGNIYCTDCGSDKKKVILQWPGKDPTKVKGPGGQFWQLAE